MSREFCDVSCFTWFPEDESETGSAVALEECLVVSGGFLPAKRGEPWITIHGESDVIPVNYECELLAVADTLRPGESFSEDVCLSSFTFRSRTFPFLQPLGGRLAKSPANDGSFQFEMDEQQIWDLLIEELRATGFHEQGPNVALFPCLLAGLRAMAPVAVDRALTEWDRQRTRWSQIIRGRMVLSWDLDKATDLALARDVLFGERMISLTEMMLFTGRKRTALYR